MVLRLLIITCFIINVIGQQYQSNSISTTPAPQPPAQVHYVNIGADLAGDYKFGYDTGKGPNGQSFREESRSADGTVRGAYGYTDANNQQRIVKYSAGKDGFKIDDDSPAPSGGSAPAPTSAPYRPAPTLPPQVYRPPQQAQQYRPPQNSQPQQYRPPQSAPSSQSYPSSSYSSSGNGNNYLELNMRPAQSYRAPAPAQTLRSLMPSSYSSPSSSSSLSDALSSYTSGLSSSSQSGGRSSSVSYPASQPTLQTYRPQSRPSAPNSGLYSPPPASQSGLYSEPPAGQTGQYSGSQPALRSYSGSGLGTTSRPEEETWGPPVINTALLSYNIGSQGSLPVSYLSTSPSTSQARSYQAQPVRSNPARRVTNANTIPTINGVSLRTYTGLSQATPRQEEKWGPPVINTALLSYNIGSRRQ